MDGHIKNLKYMVFTDVYEPAEDTFLLASCVVKEKGKILEMGTGCGYVALVNALNNPENDVSGADSSHDAVKNARANQKINKIRNAKFFVSDMFSKVRGKFDAISFNPPYLPDDEQVKNKQLYNDNGSIGIFLKDVHKFLARRGRFYLLLSSATPNYDKRISKAGKRFKITIAAKKNLFFENIFVAKGVMKKKGE